MADLTITPANTLSVSGAVVVTEQGKAGVVVTAGQVVYLDPTDGLLKLADCNSATAAARSPRGIALHAAAANQPLMIQRSGPLTLGATLAAGVAYYLSGTPGGIRPVADNTTGDYPVIVGIAASTTVLNVAFQEAGVAL